FSWVSEREQKQILEIVRRHLAPRGVAYISYNVYPGWHARGLVAELMGYHTRGMKDPRARVAEARKVAAFLADGVPERVGGYREMLQAEKRSMADKPDAYLLHDELETNNKPFYFHEFMDRAAAHGLQFLADAVPGGMMVGNLAPATEAGFDHL